MEVHLCQSTKQKIKMEVHEPNSLFHAVLILESYTDKTKRQNLKSFE